MVSLSYIIPESDTSFQNIRPLLLHLNIILQFENQSLHQIIADISSDNTDQKSPLTN